jgi:hypothetical protein
VVASRQLDIACARNVLGQEASPLHGDVQVSCSVDNEGGHPDRRKDIADIDLGIHAHKGGRGGRARAKPFEPAPPALEGWIIRARGRELGQAAAGTPSM